MSDYQQLLLQAWNTMQDKLSEARDAIDSPELFCPPDNARNAAEGYRYVLGYMHSSFERAFFEDRDFPYFRRAIPPHHKSTIDNADNNYLSAAIDGTASYRIRGHVLDHRHWRGETAFDGRRAPEYLVFSAITHYTGDSGNIGELVAGTTMNTGYLDSTAIDVNSDGSFEILIAPQRPADHKGNFIASKCADANNEEHHASYLIGRILYGDWALEVAPELEIVRLDKIGKAPTPITPEQAAAAMQRLGETTKHQVQFWNAFYHTILDIYGDSDFKGDFNMGARNTINQPQPPNASVGAAQPTNIYSGGIFQLEQDEALIVEIDVPTATLYTSFNLSNFWGESLDYANHQSSLNNRQVVADSDGKFRYVIAHRDPSINNWLDTTGQREGFLSLRWVYLQIPTELATVSSKKVAFSEIQQHLPSDTRTLSPQQRGEVIAMRQAHVQRRYRQY